MKSNNTLPKQCTVKPEVFSQNLLSWYDKHRRDLPWRAKPNEVADPYRVWLSEIMLQQTTVTAVIPYFQKFTQKWPTVQMLASAPNEEIMSYWAGLGYYARARNLHKCAKVIAEEFKGIFPHNYKDLKSLPGIGDYTTSAIMAIAFNEPANVVDGNVERVMARYYMIDTPLPAGKKDVKERAQIHAIHAYKRSGDYAQALMDLGATICTPKSPKCLLCPVQEGCQAHQTATQELYPKKTAKKPKPTKHGYVYWISDNKGRVMVHKRPEHGLLGGMYGLPTSEWVESKKQLSHLSFTNISSRKDKKHEHIKHVFTHFNLYLYLDVLAEADMDTPENHFWVEMHEIDNLGFPSLFSKVCKLIR